jgi:hypothetical protein
MTEEGKTKAKIKEVLDSHGESIYTYMPVPSGYGATTIDYLICADGLFVGIEAKKPGGKPTTRQEGVLERITQAGGTTFVIDDDEGVRALQLFLDGVIRIRKKA